MKPQKGNYKHIIPDLQNWPITKFSQDREAFIQRLIDYVLPKVVSSKSPVLEILNKTVYLEQKRVRTIPWKVDPSDEKDYWNSIEKEVADTKNADNPERAQIKILRRIIHRYSEEIIGHFVPKTHLFARKFLTGLFKRLYNNGWGRGHRLFWGNRSSLLKKIHVDGHIDELRTLFTQGTVVIVPTHYSNLDSILIGYGLDMKASVPAFSYGAGLNLYDTEILAYYMSRLGAYRVDRRKKNPIYLETLKSMASLSLIEGLNHIFFPGGTRSRSGAVEDKLKLGLLNSVIDAQRHCILKDIDQKIFIVPLALGYHFVLEAPSLIDQHLKQIGKEKYNRTRKKTSKLKSVFKFLRKLRRNDSEVFLSFGQPMDVLGNSVDQEGNSFDSRGKPVDLASYFTKGEIKNVDPQRESIYTRILADKIVESFKKENIILSSHLVSFAAFRIIERENPELDIFEILKLKPKEIVISKEKLYTEIKCLQEVLLEQRENEKVKLSSAIRLSPQDCLKDGILNVGIYHNNRVLKMMKNSKVGTDDLKLLYYYHNKMTQYELPNFD